MAAFCPECPVTWRDLYPRRFGKLPFRVRSVVEVAAEKLGEGKLELSSDGCSFTYQDPCRLSKRSDITCEPTGIIEHIGDLRDMPRSGSSSACCGTAGRMSCDHTAKRVQMERLNEAGDTGADALVTACPKCLVHRSCADVHHGGELKKRIAIDDIHVQAARGLPNK